MSTVRPGKPRSNGAPSWRAVWFETSGGTRSQRTKAFGKRSEAKAFAQRMAVDVEQRGVADPRRYTMTQFMEYWLDHCEKRGTLAAPTVAFYRAMWQAAKPHLGALRVSETTPRDFDATFTKLVAGEEGIKPRSRRTVNHIAKVLRTALEQARRWRLIGENPVRDATPPTPNASKARACSVNEIGAILAAAAGTSDELVISFMFTSGLRRGEILGLAFDAVDFATGHLSVNRTVIIGKGGVGVLREGVAKTRSSLRTIALSPDMVEMLRTCKAKVAADRLAFGGDWFDRPLLVFPGPAGYPQRPTVFTDRLTRLFRKAGVAGVSPHSMRHTLATSLIAAGIDVRTVADRLGHGDVATTLNMYAHPVKERGRAAAAVMAEVLRDAAKSAT